MREGFYKLLSSIEKSVEFIDDEIANQFLKKIRETRGSIFILGAGRSRLVGEFFGMRLMHLGKSVYIVGEVTTPSIKSDDIIIAISNSGETSSTVTIAKKAKSAGASLVALTSQESNTLSSMADTTVLIPVKEKNAYTPLGSAFEINTLIFLEVFIGEYMLKYGIQEEQLKTNHTNLE